MSIIAQVLGSVGGKLVESLDGLFTSDEERLIAKNKLTSIINDAKVKAKDQEIQLQKELTTRQSLDMNSDSWLSKNVRPMSLVFLLGVVTVLAVFDGNIVWDDYAFEIGEHYISMFESLLMMVFAFYFGGRTVEKAIAVVKKDSNNKERRDRSDSRDSHDSHDGFGPEE